MLKKWQIEAGKMAALNVGVLALQGGVAEHLDHLKRIKDVNTVPVKKPEQLEKCSGLIIPGGESTTMRKLIKNYNFVQPIKKFAQQKKIIWGTCAGLILLASEIEGEKESQTLGLLDIRVKRNAFGSQLNSFIEKAFVPKISKDRQELIFIRAPLITKVGEKIDILYQKEDQIAAVESEYIIATAFHPELTESNVFHQYFVNKIIEKIK
ncbi:MAG: pyridoxal 5'-phosphate synthase glutaminase subunit PdxT [Halanaerobiales bacterium]|nr:pyridoxal 5'-phosphate synthase glutaminase subunit PdxT [Halanaerobiales bacterium]